jgi:hypothetical protein
MLREHKVVMLPTEKAVDKGIVKSTHQPKDLRQANRAYHGNKIFEVGFEASTREWQPQHLYILSDEWIKKGDWYLIFLNHEVIGDLRKCENSNWNFSSCKKIIATTNPELWYLSTVGELQGVNIPKIGIPFIEVFIKAWNEGNSITSVNLEYIYLGKNGCDFDNKEEYFKSQLGCKIFGGECKCNLEQLKLKPNGEVIIHPVKEPMFTLS